MIILWIYLGEIKCIPEIDFTYSSPTRPPENVEWCTLPTFCLQQQRKPALCESSPQLNAYL